MPTAVLNVSGGLSSPHISKSAMIAAGNTLDYVINPIS